jgi:predicted DNA-binding ribbon-helix-helix protein
MTSLQPDPPVTVLPDVLVGSSEDSHPHKHTALVMRNVSIRGHRTSIRLEPEIWDRLAEICRREYCTPHDVCSYVAGHKSSHGSLASSLRVFILDYFRLAATEDGHRHAGHGQGLFLAEQEERKQMRKSRVDPLDGQVLDGLNQNPQRARPEPEPV